MGVRFSGDRKYVVGPLPRSKRGNQYILVLCHYNLYRYPEAMAIQKIDGVVAKKLIQMFS